MGKKRKIPPITDDDSDHEVKVQNTTKDSVVACDDSDNEDDCSSKKPNEIPGSSHASYVVTSNRSYGCCRVWDKYSYCLYCHDRQTKLVRHLKRQHSSEVLVARAMAMEEEESKATLAPAIWSRIRNFGNHDHNQNVHRGEENDLIVKKRPELGQNRPITDYVPCSDCLGYFYTQTLWQHKTTCPESDKQKKKRGGHVKEGRNLLPLKHDVTVQLRAVVARMLHDDISLIAKNDRDILNVAQHEIETSNSFKKGEVAREKMRTLGKVLKLARSFNKNIMCGEDLVKPSAFDTMIKCARTMSGYDANTQKHKAYSNAGRVGFALKDLALAVRSKYIKQGLRDKSVEVDEFLKLRESDWDKVTASARHQGEEEKWRNPQILPLTEDCVKFHGYLVDKEKEIKVDMAKEGHLSDQNYISLAEITLAQVILFNRRRPREVESIQLKDYLRQTEKKRPIQDEIKKSLTISEKIALNRLMLLMVRGKRGRCVPVLLTEGMKESLDIIVKFNQQKKEEPKYLFSRFSEDATTPLKGSPTISKLAKKANLKHPEDIRCTKLRKQIATLSQLLGLTENELEQLATHMGHNIQVHREYYRLPQETLLLAKMSKLLGIAEKGELHKHKGKSLEEIELTTENELESKSLNNDLATPTDGQKDDPSKNDDGRQYNKWTKSQEDFLFAQPEIKKLTRKRKVPGKTIADVVSQRSRGLLDNKSWKDIKNKVHNFNKVQKDRLKRKEKHLRCHKKESKKQ